MDDESESGDSVEIISGSEEDDDYSADNELTEENPTRQFLPLEGSRSKVWEHFGFPARDGKYCEPDKKKRKVVYCIVCKNGYKYCGNTTNMRFHLKEHHPLLFQALQSDDSGSSTSSSCASASVLPGQQSIPELFRQQEPFPRNSSKWIKLTESLCYFLAKDTQPFDTVNGAGFQKFVHDLESRYKSPDRKTISTSYMPQIYKSKRQAIHTELQNSCKEFSFTTDMWSSRATHSYISFTLHYINEQYQLKHYLLETKEFTEAHTGDNIAEEVRCFISEWELETVDLVAATTDNASNIKAALQHLECLHMPCFSHVLNLAVEKAMAVPVVSRALSRCRQLTSHFHRSTNASYVLKRKQIDLHSPKHNLVHDVVTRWNSSYYMVERVVELQQPISAALLELSRGDLMPSSTEFAAMSDYLSVMKPIVKITEALGGEKWVTITMIQPLLQKLLNVNLKGSSTDTNLQKLMKKAMFDNLSGRYTGQILKHITKACFLDPRLKLPAFLTDVEKDELISDFKAELELLEQQSTTSNAYTSSQTTKSPRGENLLLSLVSDIVQPDNTASNNTLSEASRTTVSEKIDLEIIRYRSEPPAILDYKNASTLLNWWKQNSSRYPYLVKLVRKYLSVPATSVPSERAFSRAGHIVNDRRACLLPQNVNMLVFLAENL